MAFHKPGAEDIFQILDLHAERRLRDAAVFGRNSEVPRISQRDEVAQLLQSNRCIPHSRTLKTVPLNRAPSIG